MTEHLEPYRRMVRAIRFVPALGRNQQEAKPTFVPVVNYSPRTSVTEATVTPVNRSPDPTERVNALVRDAVSKPTVLPVRYAIPENIGDRISRLGSHKAVTPVIIAPKIPQPDPNWVPPNAAPPQYIELNWRDLLANAQKDASAPAEVAAQPPQVEETPQEIPPVEAETPVAETAEVVEETPQEVSAVEAETPVTPVAETETETETEVVEETPQEVSAVEAETPVAETAEVEETPEGAADTEETAALVEVEETPVETPVSSEQEQPPEAEEEIIAEATPATDAVEQAPPEVMAAVAEDPQEPIAAAPESPPEEAVAVAVEKTTPEQNSSAVLVEPTPAESGKTSSEQAEPAQIQIQCPTCESTEVRKNGHRKNKQQYLCKDCGRHFAMPEQDNPATNGVNTSEVKAKNKKQAKGFGTRKAKK